MDLPINTGTYQNFANQASAAQVKNLQDRNFKGMNDSEIDKVAQDFEAMFVAQMLQPMFKEISDGGSFGGGHAEGIYRSMLTQEYGKMLAGRNELGISDMIRTELLKLQEEASQ